MKIFEFLLSLSFRKSSNHWPLIWCLLLILYNPLHVVIQLLFCYYIVDIFDYFVCFNVKA